MPLLLKGLVRRRFHDLGSERELFEQLLLPLLTQRCWDDENDPPLMLGPALRQNQPGFDRLA